MVTSQERHRLEIQANVVEENIARQLQGVSAALAGLRFDLISNDRGTDRNSLTLNLKVLADAMPGVRSFIVTDSQGIMTASNRQQLVGQDFSQQEYFKTPKAGMDATALYVSPPFRSVLGPNVLSATRVMIGSDGKFAGLVSAVLDPEYFEIAMRSVLYADDMWVRLAHGDGKLLLSTPYQEKLLGVDLDVPGSSFSQHRATAKASSFFEKEVIADDGTAMVAVRTVLPPDLRLDKPLIIQIGRRLDAVYAPWQEDTITLGLFCVLLAFGLCIALYFSQRRRRALADARALAKQTQMRNARRLDVVLEGANLGLWEWDLAADRLTVNNREWAMMGYKPGEFELTSKVLKDLIHPDDGPLVESSFTAHIKGTSASHTIEHRIRHRDGHWVWVLNHAMVLDRDAKGRPLRILGTHLDISERKRVEAGFAENTALLEHANVQLSQLSLTDGLTGVPNRRHFDQTLKAEWTRGARQKQPLSLLMIDIDHFKLYNDSHGHLEGDNCLRQVASALASSVMRGSELFARYGGEEFVALLPSTNHSAAGVVAQRCLDRLDQARIKHGAAPVSPWVTVSIGIASIIPGPEIDADNLVQSADAALYRAKEQGRNRFV